MNTFYYFRHLLIGAVLLNALVNAEDSGGGGGTVVQESQVKSITPTNNPTKVFVRRRIFRKIVKDNSSSEEPAATSTTSSPVTTSTTPRPRTLYSLVKKLDSSTVTGSSLKSQMASSNNIKNKKFNFQSLKYRLGINNNGSTTEAPNQNNSLVMIPLPPSQRKPYTPVIMQVSKSTTSKPAIHKLDKMFVPIGIYGKVIENGTTEAPPPSSSTLKTSIRHKGTDMGTEKTTSRKVKGIADSVDITYGRPNVDKYSITTERPDIKTISFTTESNDEAASFNNLRRGDENHRKHYDSGLTLMTPPKLGTSKDNSPSTLTDALGSYSSYASYNTKKPTVFDSITDSMSRIPSLVPSLFHKGLTSLASYTSSLKENPFVDEHFDESLGSKKHSPLISGVKKHSTIPASVPGGYIGGIRDQATAGSSVKATKTSPTSASTVDISEYETLEYFRKRPHLLAQLKRERALAQQSRAKLRMSKGFKPVNAPEYLAREYYKTTSTSSTPQQAQRSSKKLRGSWLLRNSNEYVVDRNDRVAKMWREMLNSFTLEDPSFMTHRASGPTSALTEKWTQIKRKYDPEHINEAKERILTLLDSGYGDEALHEFADEEELQHHHDHGYDAHAHMPPPPPPKALSLTKGLSSAAVGAFKDLVKFFKLGISVGGGHSHEPVKYEEIVDNQEASQSDWRPVERKPLISFSAGISLKSRPKPKHIPHHVISDIYDEPHHHSHTHDHLDHHGVPSHYDDHHHHHDVSSHYSASSKPYVPSTYSYVSHHDPVELSPTPYSYTEEEEIVTAAGTPATAAGPEYAAQPEEEVVLQDSEGYASNNQDSYSEAGSSYFPVRSKAPSKLLSSSSLAQAAAQWSSQQQQPQNPSDEYELVPSSVYLSGQGDPNDIAAVVKPAGVSDELIRSALPPGMRNLRIIDYPHSNLNSVSNALRSPSEFKRAMKQLRESYVRKESAYLPVEESLRPQHALRTIESYSPLKSIRPAEIFTPPETLRPAATRNPYRNVPQFGSLNTAYYSSSPAVVTPQGSLVGALGGLEGAGNVFAQANRINDFYSTAGRNYVAAQNFAQAAQAQRAPQKDSLGFTTDYNLPSNLDPDIAALLKSELDKDDIPDDVRQEFLEAKEEEAKEQAKKNAAAAAAGSQVRRSDDTVDLAKQALIDELLRNAAKSNVAHSVPTQPTYTNSPPKRVSPSPHPVRGNARSFTEVSGVAPQTNVATRFFAPIPITPTLMTTALKNPRYSSPVPRYVIELASKLQGDRNVQGIVRVSAKRGRGLPPIEYLYPVRG